MSLQPAAAVEHILEKLRVRLVQFASFKGMGEAADDVAQDCLLVLLRKYPDVTTEAELVPLAYGICKLKILEARRKKSRMGSQLDENLPVEDPSDDAQSRMETAERQKNLIRAIQELSRRDQALFRMRLEGRSTAEIAKLMNVPEGTIYVWEYRYRKILFAKLA